MQDDAKKQLIQALKDALGELAGQDLGGVDPRATFFELGFDSLLLTQAAGVLKNRFRVKITFRQLLEDLTTLEAIASYMERQMPATAAPVLATNPPPAPPPLPKPAAPASPAEEALTPQPARATAGVSGGGALERVMREQLALMSKQLEMLRGAARGDLPAVRAAEAGAARPVKTEAATLSKPENKSFGPYRPINTKQGGDLNRDQERALADLIERYTRKTPGSKRQTQQYRPQLSDPRTAAGFRRCWKEMVYPIVTTRSDGARFWDVDGNEYIDVTMGFGTNLLGHNPAFVRQAIADQLKNGLEVGPQSPHTGKAAQLLCELTGHERAAFCNTGSEAILAAIRVARTVTGRTRIATTGGFHGICDEVLVRAGAAGSGRGAVPIAPGIPSHVAREVLVVDYGSEESLEILTRNMDDLAIVLVEPVQSRHPDLQPREFLHELRRVTAAHDTPLLFDEVITGFRCNLGGAQAHFGVRADLATWGKIIGGGLPIGALTGSAKYMDALDGGAWRYGDESFPEAGVTFFAGTYVRHPLAMAASRAVLGYLKDQGPGLQQNLNAKCARVAADLRDFLKTGAVPIHFENFASIFYMHFDAEVEHGSLLWFYLRSKGVHIWENRPWFLSTAHTDEDIAFVVGAIKESVVEMQAVGFLPAPERVDRAANGAGKPGASDGQFLPAARDGEAPPPAARPKAIIPVEVREHPAPPANPPAPVGDGIDFSVYFFGNYDAEYRSDKYDTIIEAAKFADRNGFKAIWIPERHFHAVGGFSPNPSVIAAALARETRQLQLRAGSVVLPLHHPVRVAEEWAVVDNLSNGRAGISIASGWHPNDFVFAPGAFDRRRELCWEGCEIIQKLWRGEEVDFPTGGSNRLGVKLHPMPKQPRLPVWLTCIHKESYVKAAEMGLGVLGYTMNSTLAELAEKIRLYREAFARSGHDPRRANVTVLLHTFVAGDRDEAVQIARGPMREYLRSYLDNSQKRVENTRANAAVEAEDIEYLLDRGFNDYVNGKALIGSPESCAGIAAQLEQMGVDEIGCFLDFGIEVGRVLAQLPQLLKLKCLCGKNSEVNHRGAAAPDTLESAGEPERIIRLTDAQRGLVALSALGPDASRAYTEGNTLELRGPVDLAALRRALQGCVDRHEALRTSLSADSQTQTVHRSAELETPFEDLSALLPEAQSARLRELFQQLERAPLDLRQAPVMRCRIIKISEGTHWLLLFFHHSLNNGPSYWILFDDLCAMYESGQTGRPFARSVPMQLSDYVRWRAEREKSAESEADKAFWLRELAEPPMLSLPWARRPAAVKSYLGGRGILEVDAALTLTLRKVGAAHQCSLYMVLLTAFQSLLHRLSGQDDLIVGTPFESEVRSCPGGDRLVANTTNMTCLRSRVDAETSFSGLLRQTKRQVMECQDHQEYFFGNLLQSLGIRSDGEGAGLFTAGFNYESGSFRRSAAGLEVRYLTKDVPYRGPKDTSMFGLNLNIAEQEGRLLCECDYDGDLFSAAAVSGMLAQYQTTLGAFAANPGQAIARLELLDERERRQVLSGWNATQCDYPRGLCLDELVEQQASRTPGAVAVVFEGGRLTYEELMRRAERHAGVLRSLGVQPESLVGVCMHRSVEMIVALLGILKAGGAYMPLDPKYPAERLAFMLEDARPLAVVTQQSLLPIIPANEPRVICIDAPAEAVASGLPAPKERTPRSLAYVLYTSGSTGRPKGVAIEHRNAVAFVSWARGVFSEEDLSGVLFATSINFDLSVFELFVTLACGGKVVLAENVLQLPSLSAAGEVRLINTVPSAVAELLREGGIPASVKTINLAGEPLAQPLVEELYRLPSVQKVYDLYGPTECTTYSTFALRERGGGATIGRPIANTRVYILDRHLQPVPIGAPGELFIGGDGVARGYLNRPELTAERFIADPFSEGGGGRLYRTGDLIRYRAGGNIEYLGRLDQQVKVRGFRIELGEIESALDAHSGIRESVVTVREDAPGQKRIVAYVVPSHPESSDGRASPESAAVAEMRGHWEANYRSAIQTNSGLEVSGDGENPIARLHGWSGSDHIEKDLNEWADRVAQNLLRLRPKKILELGCGTGLLTLRLAPHCEEYRASDFSGAAVAQLAGRIAAAGGALSHTRVFQAAADDFRSVEGERFDAVILNSVVEYLPSANYLTRVLENAAKALAPGGFIYLGDVPNYSLRELFHRERQRSQASPAGQEPAELGQQLRIQIARDTRLMFSSDFFREIARRLPAVAHVDVGVITGAFADPATTLHADTYYDVFLHTERNSPGAAFDSLAWSEGKLLRQEILARLQKQTPVLVITGVPHQRLLKRRRETEFPVGQPNAAAPAIEEGREEEASPGADLEEWRAIARAGGYDMEAYWSDDGLDARCRLVFRSQKSAPPSGRYIPVIDSVASRRPPQEWASNPLHLKLADRLVPELQVYVKDRLPAYMCPNDFVLLDALPMTPNGKVDRKALPAPTHAVREFIPPKTLWEKRVAEIWQSVLGAPRVGATDNFFELGGDSLSGLRVVNELQRLTGERISLIVIFEAPTAGRLAGLLEKNYASSTSASRQASGARVTAEHIAQMRALVTPVPRPPQDKAPRNPRAVFILSPMRSGSTLLRTMLSAHPRLFAPPELQLLQFDTLAQRVAAFKNYDRYLLEGTIRALMEIDGAGMSAAAARMEELADSGCSVREFYRHLQDSVKPRLLVDKTPDYAMDLHVLLRAESWFEDAFYVHLVRHPLGMIRSYEKGRFILESLYRGRHNFDARQLAELTWLVSHENILEFFERVPAARRHQIQFERLVSDPRTALSGLCKALGVEFDESVLRPYERGQMTDGIHPMSPQVGDSNFASLGSIEAGVATRWRGEYSEDSVSGTTRRLAERLGCSFGLGGAPQPAEREARQAAPRVVRAARDARRMERTDREASQT